ncbi:MAG: hypothetical protein HYV62_09665 [Candidatus Rokubacteria bacterium]|nr:hypothetical protein [Candidatus Rokubacteria bacterium]
MTPTDQGIDVDIDPPGPNARHGHVNKGPLGAGEPLLVGVIEFVTI